ncbi:MAG: DUF2859 domain-containing protein [Alphaproteobacteria bacterium]|nr:DUF2859 domain-containing protein [Alphaproteobacteria bacterium]
MKAGRRFVLVVAGALAAASGNGAERLIVVHDAGGTVDAAPYVERTEISDRRVGAALQSAREALADLRFGRLEVFPVHAGPLRAGPPALVRVAGLPAPVFAIGCDGPSRSWLAAHGRELRERGAAGFVVSCATRARFRRVGALAARLGLAVEPLPGAAFADVFGAVSYPFVAEPSP